MNVSPGPPPGPGIGRTPDEQRFSGVPALNENRFISNHVLLQIDKSVTRDRVLAAATQLGLVLLSSQDIGNRTIYLFDIGKQDVRKVVARLEQLQIVAVRRRGL